MKCFACNKEIEESTCCPYCGYSFTADSDFSCPNCDEGICMLTENACTEENFVFCEIKQEVEKETF